MRTAITRSPIFPACLYIICSIIAFYAVSSALAKSATFKSTAASSAFAWIEVSFRLGFFYKYSCNSSRRAFIVYIVSIELFTSERNLAMAAGSWSLLGSCSISCYVCSISSCTFAESAVNLDMSRDRWSF